MEILIGKRAILNGIEQQKLKVDESSKNLSSDAVMFEFGEGYGEDVKSQLQSLRDAHQKDQAKLKRLEESLKKPIAMIFTL